MTSIRSPFTVDAPSPTESDQAAGDAIAGPRGAREATASPETRRWFGRSLLVALAVALSFAGLRAVHLTADTPTEIGRDSMAIHVDEGYKSLAPRNLAVLGTIRSDPHDEYQGWWRQSPITQSFHYLVFELGAPDLAHVRVLALVSTTLLLVVVAWRLLARGPLWIAVAMTALLGTSVPFFFFSRVSLFETPVALVLCVGVFHAARAGHRSLRGLLVLAAWAAVAVLGIKISALVFFAPIGVVLALGWLLGRTAVGRRSGLVLGGLAAVLLVVLWLNLDILSRRMDLALFGWASSVAIGPLADSAPLLFAAALLVVLHFSAVLGRSFLRDAYLSMLAAATLAAPLILGVFPYNPVRYYSPLFPLFVLLAAEWIRWRGWTREIPRERPAWLLAVGTALAAWSAMTVIEGINYFVVARLPIEIGAYPGVSEKALLVAVAPVVLVASFLWWRRPRWWNGARTLSLAILALLGIHAARSTVAVADFLLHPTYQGIELGRMLREAVPPGSTVAGDWAPFAALGSDLRPIYMAPARNLPTPESGLRPGYFLFSETQSGMESLEWIREQSHVSLLPPIARTQYAGLEVILYPLRFDPVRFDPVRFDVPDD